MVVTMLSGWTGQAAAAAPAAPRQADRSTAHPPAETVTYDLQPGGDGTITIVATGGDVTLRKSVRSDGTSTATIERGDDTVRIDTTAVSVVVRRGPRAVTIPANALSEEETARAQAVLAGSPALRGLRAIVAGLEQRGATDHHALAVRLTSALLAQLEGDPGAIPRLGRELDARLASGVRRVRRMATDCIATYSYMVTKASWDLQMCYQYHSIWDPLRQACTFYWVLAVESAWFQFLACSSFPVK